MEAPFKIWVWRDSYFYLVCSGKKPPNHIIANEYVLAVNKNGSQQLVTKLREGLPLDLNALAIGEIIVDKKETEKLLNLAADAIEFYQSF